MKEIMVRVPGSCGEFIQGYYEEKPCLVSCPVDLYAFARIAQEHTHTRLNPKSQRLVDIISDRYQLPSEKFKSLYIEMQTEIPFEKGMASSTADLAAVGSALSLYFGLNICPDTMATLCVEVEPTDSVMFQKTVLFDHVHGEVLKEYAGSPKGHMIVVDFKGGVNTLGLHGHTTKRTDEEERRFHEILTTFERGLEEDNMFLVGTACTESARLNQKIIYKPHLEPLIELSALCKGYGVVTGHSGTVIGIMYDDQQFDYQKFMQEFVKIIPKQSYEALYFKKIISGGTEIVVQK